MTQSIPLAKGQCARVDDADYPRLAAYHWFLSGTGYAVAQIRVNGRFRLTYMHRFLLNAAEGQLVDHINNCRLDNRRSNLRLATPCQNAHNRWLSERSRTGLKGVSYHQRRQQYQARIQCEGQRYHLGYFDDPDQAALAYDEAVRLLFGAFGRYNYPEEEPSDALAQAVRHRLQKRGVKVEAWALD